MPDLTPGTRVLVTFPGPVEGVVDSRRRISLPSGIVIGPIMLATLAALGATVTPVIPDEPAVGSVWIDGDGRTIVHTCRSDESRAWLALHPVVEEWRYGEYVSWREVVARGGRLLHDAGTVAT